MVENHNHELIYLLGLFEGDKYEWTGTFGITNRNKKILERASHPLSIFGKVKWKKDEKGFFRILITSRPGKRLFLSEMQKIKEEIPSDIHHATFYLAGKYDADGTRWKDRDRLKITYSLKDDIEFDIKLLASLGMASKKRPYKNRKAVDLEISAENARKFISLVKEHSIRLSS